nr:unnamed protein product [Callosobruchus chinensis]
MRLEVRPIGRADPSLSQTHRRQAVQMPALRPLLQPQRPSGAPYKTAPQGRVCAAKRPGKKSGWKRVVTDSATCGRTPIATSVWPLSMWNNTVRDLNDIAIENLKLVSSNNIFHF